ncbi:MAG: helix-turn-helix domain-containing protein [Dongiaceae bacterium]
MESAGKLLLDFADIRREYGLSRTFMYRQLEVGALRAVKVGRLTRFRRDDVEAWIATLPVYARGPNRRCTVNRHGSLRKLTTVAGG